LKLKCGDILVSRFAFKRLNVCRYAEVYRPAALRLSLAFGMHDAVGLHTLNSADP
jgi:hypothetical protein